MRRLLAAVAMLAGCAKAAHLVNKGPPQRVQMTATESPPRIVFQARRSASRVELAVKQLREVAVARTVIYGSSETYTDSGNMLWELLEIPFGLLISPSLLLDFKASLPPTPGQIDLGGQPALILLNPFVRFMSVKFRGPLPSDRIAFKDPPRKLGYRVRLPLEGVTVSYRILDDARAALTSGTGRTDLLGVIAIEDVPETAVGIEVTSGGTTAVVPIQDP